MSSSAPPSASGEASGASGTSQKSARLWCATLNNWGEGEHDAIKEAITQRCVWGVVGTEIAPTTSTPHLQMAMLFNRARTIGFLKTNFSQRAHFEICKGTAEQNREYCTKDHEYWEHGQIPENAQGTRSDLEEATSYLQMVCGNVQLMAMRYPAVYVKYAANFERLANRFVKAKNAGKKFFEKIVTWIYGPTGSGKTHYVVDTEEAGALWISPKTLKWWHAYDNEPAVLFDDFRGDFCTYHELLRLLDVYDMNSEVKGGYVSLNNVKRIYITSCLHPSEVYDTREDIGQLLRRIDTIWWMDEDHVRTDVTKVRNYPRVMAPAPVFLTPSGFSTASTVIASAGGPPALKRTTATTTTTTTAISQKRLKRNSSASSRDTLPLNPHQEMEESSDEEEVVDLTADE